MKRNVASTVLAIVLASTFVLSMAATARGDEDSACSLARAAGTYGFTDTGAVIGVGPRVATGIITLDSAGNVTDGKATSNLKGQVTEETVAGSYTVNPDCTGTFNIELRDLSGKLLLVTAGSLVWEDNMEQLRGIFTSAKLPNGKLLLTVISIDGRKQ